MAAARRMLYEAGFTSLKRGDGTFQTLDLAFGGGMGRLAQTCGVVTGAFMILGLKCGGEDKDSREMAYQMVREFARRFEARHGSLLCKDLLGCDISTPEGLQIMKEKDLRSAVCTELVRDAAEVLEKKMLNAVLDTQA